MERDGKSTAHKLRITVEILVTAFATLLEQARQQLMERQHMLANASPALLWTADATGRLASDFFVVEDEMEPLPAKPKPS